MVTTPVSIVEWFYNFYQETDNIQGLFYYFMNQTPVFLCIKILTTDESKKRKNVQERENRSLDSEKNEELRPIECTLHPGELIFIPHGIGIQFYSL